MAGAAGAEQPGPLLKQAERLVGKRFAEVAQVIPPELLAKWDGE